MTALGAITAAPDVDAFVAGLQLGLGSLLTLAAMLAGVSVLRRIVGA
jgi:hypothetical protein